MMVAMLDPAIVLGVAVVKAACKLWAGDPPFAQDLEAAVTDLVAERVAGWREQRQLKRQFDQIEERVTDRILRYLAHEFASLSENERNAAVLAVRDTFDKARLTDRVLFHQDLDPLYLERFLRRVVPDATRDLGESGTGLYDRLLPECCAYVISIITTLPRFSAVAFTEILRRESLLINAVDQVLARLPKQGDPAEPHDSAFTTAYRRHVTTKWDRMNIFGADVSTKNYPLSVAYVSLNVTSETFQQGRIGRIVEGVQRVESALQGTSRIFLRGAPGSGKTTLLRWLAVRAASDEFPAPLKEWNGTIPFFIPLREYAKKDFPAEPLTFIRHAGIHLPSQAPHAWAERILSEGRGLLLIDGIDELPTERREGVRRWLRGLIGDFRSCRFVVTSRSAATAPDWLAAEGFNSAVLEPLSPHDIQAFVQHWHEAVMSEMPDEEERLTLTQNQHNLTSNILSTRHLLNLACTPLLCALLCALYRDRRTVLPRDRMELYDAALAMLLERRDIERGIDHFGLDLSRREKTVLLQDLAYWLITNGLSEAEEPRVTGQLTRTLVGLRHVTAPVEQVYRYLVERSGLLHETAAGCIGFIHRTFEEYLAAKAFVDNDQLDMLVANAVYDQWREVVVMAVGHAPRKQREKLVRDLLAKADHLGKPRGVFFPISSPDIGAQNALIITAFACIENMPSLPPDLIASLRKYSREVIPPKSIDMATMLASAGDFGLALFAEYELSSQADTARLIRTASLVGGQDALKLIERTVKSAERQHGVDFLNQDVMTSAWLRFDPDVFARDVVSGTLYARHLHIHNPELLKSLRYIEGLESLHLGRGCDLDDVGELPSLRALRVDEIANLSPIWRYQNLTELRVAGVESADLAPLSSLRKLETLRIRFARSRIDFNATSLSEIRSLRILEVYGARNCDVRALDAIRPTFRTNADGMVLRW